MPTQVSFANARKVQLLTIQVERLPLAERKVWRQRLHDKLLQKPGWQVSGLVVDPSKMTESEWDLDLANWLDKAYGAVSDRVEVVAKKTAEVAAKAAETAGQAAASVGWGLWPVAAAAVALAWALSTSKKA